MDETNTDVGGALLRAAEAGDRPAFEAAIADYKALAARNGLRQDGRAKGFGILGGAVGYGGIAAPLGQALAKRGGEGLAWVEWLAGDEMIDLRCLACLLLGQIGQSRPQDIVDLAHRLAADGNWGVREFIANALDDGLGPTQGDFLFDLMSRWVRDPDENVRRVPTNALMRYGRRHPEKVVGLMGALLHDDSAYVRKNVAFCLGVMGLEYHPTLGVRAPERPRWLLGILREWAADPDERARWIIAETLGRKWTKACPAEAAELLNTLAADERKSVRRQALASLKTIAKQSPGIVEAEPPSQGRDTDERM